MDNQRYYELKETKRLYTKSLLDMEKDHSIKKVVNSQYDGDHESQKLKIQMVSKKNMHWTNGKNGK